MTPKDFLKLAFERRWQARSLSFSIRTGMTEIMGELPAVSALAYTGDASDGDLASFVMRLEELLGEGAPVVLSAIVREEERKRDALGDKPEP